MASITSLGTGSNIDLESLLTKIVDAEKTPQQDLIDQNTSLAKATISALGTVKSKLATFQDSLTDLKTTSYFQNRTATSSNTDAFTATATTSADISSYSIEVLDLAKANKVASGSFTSSTDTPGAGTLTIGVNGLTFDVAVGASDTLVNVRDAINNAANNTGVTASLLTVSDGSGGTATKLVLTSNKTGAANQISVSVADGDGNNTDSSGLSRLYYLKGDANSQLSEVTPAQDAQISVDGFAATSSTNVFDNVISGVTITALQGATDPLNPPSGTLTVTKDTSSLHDVVTSFVSAYNDVVKTLNSLTTVDSTTGNVGALTGDSSLRAIQTQLRSIIANPVSGAPSDFSTLAFLGISTEKDGTLSIDDTKLTNAISTRFDDVATLFAGDKGVAGQLYTALDQIVGSGGVISTRVDTLNTQLSNLSDQQATLDARIASLSDRYRAQFTALDSLVSQLNSTGTFLTQQLAASAQIISRKSSSTS